MTKKVTITLTEEQQEKPKSFLFSKCSMHLSRKAIDHRAIEFIRETLHSSSSPFTPIIGIKGADATNSLVKLMHSH